MKLLFKQALIVDTNSSFHLQKKDILVLDGIIISIHNEIIEDNATIIAAEGLCISQGFTDIFANFNDPGLEQKETLVTGANAALKGGYTTVCIIPNTNPTIDTKTAVDYIIQQSKNLTIQVLPIGAITTKTDGKTLTEMIEMQHAGAAAFSDGIHGVQNANILIKALQYVKQFNGTIIQLPYNDTIAANGLMQEGIVATQLGLQGIPALAEETAVARDIELCNYTNSPIHLTGISTSKSVQLIADAKHKGLPVTCSVTPYHLLLDETELEDYNTNAKVNNPLRTKEDVFTLQKALLEGTIDCVASHHQPHEMDAKQCEFAAASFGMSTIEHTFNAIASVPNITAEKIAEVLSNNVRNILGLKNNSLQEGGIANFTAFTLQGENIITQKDFISKGKNSAFIGKKLKGQIIATIYNNNQFIY
jgi:dihydroorotase